MATGALSALRRSSIAIAIAIVFVLGFGTTVYLSLRSPEVKVPDVMGKNRTEAEQILGEAGLNFRVRGARPSSELKPDTVVFQLPRPGEVVKVGQTIAMDVSRGLKEGESSEAVIPEPTPEAKPADRNTNDANTNENKPKRNRNTNKNANENANAVNRNANANRPPSNRNANNGNVTTSPNANSGRPASNANSNRGTNQNENRRPPAPRPSPVTPNR